MLFTRCFRANQLVIDGLLASDGVEVVQVGKGLLFVPGHGRGFTWHDELVEAIVRICRRLRLRLA